MGADILGRKVQSLSRQPEVVLHLITSKHMPRRESEHRRIAVSRSKMTWLKLLPLVERRNRARIIARPADVTLATEVELVRFGTPKSDHGPIKHLVPVAVERSQHQFFLLQTRASPSR